jgi:ornithine carbamoyltransferase
MNHFLNISDLSKNELRSIIDGAKKRKSERGEKPNSQPDADQPIQGKTMIMFFAKPSTRTRISFDLAVKQLGGSSIILNEDEIHYGKGDETIKDTAKVLSQYGDILMIRTDSHKDINEFKKYLEIPIINGLTNLSHPCQIMSDILTFEESKGSIEGKTIAWLGDGNNVVNSFIEAATKFEFEIRIACPKKYQPDKKIVEVAKKNNCKLLITEDPYKAAKDADCIMTDKWISMGDKGNKNKKKKALKKYQVNKRLMKVAKPDAIFMHCLPANREEEVTSEVMDGKQSVVWLQAFNRIHAQKSIIEWCIK